MKPVPSFYTALAALLRSAGIADSAWSITESRTHTLRMQDVDIEVVGSQPGFINLFSFLDKVPELSVDMMKFIVLANRYQAAYPSINVSIVEEAQTQLVLWSRLPLEQAQEAVLTDLLVRFVNAVQRTRSWLSDGAPTTVPDRYPSTKRPFRR